MHDIGKIAVSDEILFKPGRLTTEEFEKVKFHTVISSDVLAEADARFRWRFGKSGYLKLAQVIVRSHHERWDGGGYPDGLRGEEIPLSARISAICDVYDAVTSDRVYKRAWSHEEAIEMIRRDRGERFDPSITELFLEHEGRFRQVGQNHAGGGGGPLPGMRNIRGRYRSASHLFQTVILDLVEQGLAGDARSFQALL